MNNANYPPFERNRYFFGKLLTVRDFETEQRYYNGKRAMLNRLVTGAGVVCGLGVTASDESTLMISSGMALDYQGREIVVPETIFRKLQMLDGHETLSGRQDAYLCLRYAEEDVEPVNATGIHEGDERQFDLTRETYRLYLTGETPSYQELLEAAGKENVSVLYQSDELTLVLCVPSSICAGEEFEVQVLVVKNENTPSVRFSLQGENTFAESDNNRVCLEHREGRDETRKVYMVDFPLRCKALSDVENQFFPSGCELNVDLGSHHYKNYLTVDAGVYLCRGSVELSALRQRLDSLEHHTYGPELPLYLAKLELLWSAGRMFVSGLTNLPFQQTVTREAPAQSRTDSDFKVTTSVRSLEYWQKPDVRAVYTSSTGALHLDFGIPSPEQYDYSVVHGCVDIVLPSGLRVNSRVYSGEVAHGLGAGAVDVRLSVEFLDQESGETALLCGNSEVFKSKAIQTAPPWVEAAAVVYPERGTMNIGLWLHDTVEGKVVRVHYFAQKPERDTSRILSQPRLSMNLEPEFARLPCRGKLQFQAEVVGSDDKAVTWSVRGPGGGAIDHNGLYQAPEQPGTYEISAVARADGKVGAIAFVVVE